MGVKGQGKPFTVTKYTRITIEHQNERFINFHDSSCFQSKAVLVMLSLGQFTRVIEMLYSMRYFDRAALFIEACQEFGLMEQTVETRILLTILHFHLHVLEVPSCKHYICVFITDDLTICHHYVQ